MCLNLAKDLGVFMNYMALSSIWFCSNSCIFGAKTYQHFDFTVVKHIIKTVSLKNPGTPLSVRWRGLSLNIYL